jgi:putative HD superfamily hydrolase of NAD metabolism
MKNEIFDLQHDLSKRLTEKRFYHSLGVQGTSVALAALYSCDIEKANLAGLLHDCAKCLSDKELVEECRSYKLPISDVENRNPYLLHGKLGAYYAEHRYGIGDEEVLSAITFHTTGKAAMTMLEKIIFTADYIEPNRLAARIPELNHIRKAAFCNLDEAVFKILENTLNYLNQEHQEIDLLTVAAYDYYKGYH